MGRRQKARKERRFGSLIRQTGLRHLPKGSKAVAKTVPAHIRWEEVSASDRTDVEVIGECLIYEDGSQDIIVYSEITQDAKNLIHSMGQLQYCSSEE